MRLLIAYARKNRRSHAGLSEWFQNIGRFISPVSIGAFSLISAGMLKASDPGQLVWKEQRGSMKSAEIGVVVWKEQPFHNDAVSRAFVFERMKQAGPVTWFYNKAVSKSFEEHQSFQQIRFPQWPVGEIVQQEEFESLKFKLGELEAFARRYPNAAGFLEGVIGSMRNAVSQFSSGKVFFNGNWVTRAEHQNLVLQRNELISRNAKEREVLDKRIHALQAIQVANTKARSQWILAGGGAWLLLMLGALLTRSWKIASSLVVALVAVAGWFTYAESGFGWTEHVARAVKGLPSLLPFMKLYHDKSVVAP